MSSVVISQAVSDVPEAPSISPTTVRWIWHTLWKSWATRSSRYKKASKYPWWTSLQIQCPSDLRRWWGTKKVTDHPEYAIINNYPIQATGTINQGTNLLINIHSFLISTELIIWRLF
jgi:hypothetical protein